MCVQAVPLLARYMVMVALVVGCWACAGVLAQPVPPNCPPCSSAEGAVGSWCSPPPCDNDPNDFCPGPCDDYNRDGLVSAADICLRVQSIYALCGFRVCGRTPGGAIQIEDGGSCVYSTAQGGTNSFGMQFATQGTASISASAQLGVATITVTGPAGVVVTGERSVQFYACAGVTYSVLVTASPATWMCSGFPITYDCGFNAGLVTVTPPPEIAALTVTGPTSCLLPRQSAALNARVPAGLQVNSIRWQRQSGGAWLDLFDGPSPFGSVLYGTGRDSLVIAGVGPADTGAYRLRVQTPCGELLSQVRAVQVAPGVGVCCSPDGSCVSVTAACGCPSGSTFLLWEGSCQPGLCAASGGADPLGACCVDGGACVMTTSARCAGVFNGASSCLPNPCPVPAGVCCDPVTGACSLVPASNTCDSYLVLRPGSPVCTPGSCQPELFACCFSGGACTLSYLLDCEGFAQPATTCQPSPCFAPRMSCCDRNTGTCTNIEADQLCPPGTVAYRGLTCAWAPCQRQSDNPPANPPVLGVCCRGATCQQLYASGACTGQFSLFLAGEENCNVGLDPQTPCCKADFDKGLTVTVNDLFLFLNSWFAVEALADASGDQLVSVEDIFEYLRAWFLGCE